MNVPSSITMCGTESGSYIGDIIFVIIIVKCWDHPYVTINLKSSPTTTH